jgi:hypothetical protein
MGELREESHARVGIGLRFASIERMRKWSWGSHSARAIVDQDPLADHYGRTIATMLCHPWWSTPPGRYNFNPIVEVNQDGVKQGVETPDMPGSAPDFAACTRIALSDMAIPSEVFDKLRKTQSTTSTNEVTEAQRTLVGNPAVVVLVVVGLGEIVFEAGAYTVMVGVTVQVVGHAMAKLNERCRKVRENCIDSCTNSDLPTGTYSGDPYHACLRRCIELAGCF